MNHGKVDTAHVRAEQCLRMAKALYPMFESREALENLLAAPVPVHNTLRGSYEYLLEALADLEHRLREKEYVFIEHDDIPPIGA